MGGRHLYLLRLLSQPVTLGIPQRKPVSVTVGFPFGQPQRVALIEPQFIALIEPQCIAQCVALGSACTESQSVTFIVTLGFPLG